MKGFLNTFKAFDLVIIGMMAALGIAVKPIIVPLVHLITGPLFIPGGALAGGFYMMWIVLGAAIVNKRGAATLIGVVQAIIVIATGVYGTHGMVSLITYSLPGLTVDVILWITRLEPKAKIAMFIGGISANICGVILTNLVFFRLPLVPLLFSMSAGALSGALGGLLAWLVASRFSKLNI